MIKAIQKILSKPLWYIRRITSPFRWLQRIKANREANKVSLLLPQMHARKSKNWTAYRNHKLSEILRYAYRYCPYYKNLFERYHVDIDELHNFDRLPLLDKATIGKHKNDIISHEINYLDIYTMNTGGSTGEPFEFMASKIAGKMFEVHLEYLHEIIGYKKGDRIVSFDGSSIPGKLRKNNIFWIELTSGEIPWGKLAYSSLYLTQETIPYYVKHILEYKPSILRGYPSFISDISNYILNNRISVSFQVKGIILTSENAFNWQVENIKKAFNTNIFFEYGVSEVSVCAYTVDNTHEYICSPFYGFTEVLNPDGSPVNIGETGELVVTGFYNFALPFIRYKTGDLAIFNGDVNGIVRLGKVIGRTQDYIYTDKNEKIALTALIFGQHYHAFRNIRKWQLEQNVPGKIVIKIVKGTHFSNEDQAEIENKFKSICNVDVNCEFVSSIALTQRGKFQFLIQNIKH